MYTYVWYHWITFFFFYSFFGWIFESTYVSLKSGHFVNRGFLRLPMLPLYGTGAVMMLWVSLPVQDSKLLVFLSGVVGATLLEYVTGYVMERLFKVRYWDYSKQPFNLHGYICLSSSIAWGFLTILMTEVLHVPVAHFVLKMPPAAEFSFLGIVGALFVTDTVHSVQTALNLAKALDAMTKIKTELEELQLQMALLRADTSQKFSEFKEETMHRLKTEADIHIAAAHHLSSHVPNIPATKAAVTERLAALNERAKTLSENRAKLYSQAAGYRKALLRNPTATSKRFADAFRELKETIKEIHN